jgi:hypothetical protein
MTLLLTAMNTVAIHQSSDYRLTDLSAGKPVEDSVGAKQVSFGGMDFAAQLSFTGVAAVGGVRIRDLISKTVASATKASEIEGVVNRLVASGTTAVKGLPQEKRFLTMLLAVTQESRLPRLFLMSNADQPDNRRLLKLLDVLEPYEIVALSPRTLICRFTEAVSVADRKFLRQLSQSDQPAREIQAALGEINKRAAAKSKDWISAECMVSSLLADGTRGAQIVGSTNVGDFIKRHFRAAPGKKITLVQSAGRFTGGRSRPAPATTEIGEPRSIAYSAPATAKTLSVENSPGPQVKLDAISGAATVQKNLWVTMALNTVTLEIGPLRHYSQLPISIE